MPANSHDLDRCVDTIMPALDGLWLDWERRQDDKSLVNVLDACMMLATH
ncbi:hypothetical protein [Roseovarius pelagicus]|uniref:Uncharacterized protein n=1 Tax=Roseovarius pelagicus TaxID=2980108 RepID=A0ABY6D5V3_9RHOB|nr:hypothetical protein [Roseovarius pelagicus]UXX81526.1 hypothetical protein N7U68_00235 [Roseovarius pelagicus]